MEKSSDRCCYFCSRSWWITALVILGLSVCSRCQNQQVFEQTSDRRTGSVKCSDLQSKVYTFKHVHVEQQEQLNIRARITQLINQTYDDELLGVVDLNKYEEIRTLVEKLPTKDPQKKKRGFFPKMFHH